MQISKTLRQNISENAYLILKCCTFLYIDKSLYYMKEGLQWDEPVLMNKNSLKTVSNILHFGEGVYCDETAAVSWR